MALLAICGFETGTPPNTAQNEATAAGATQSWVTSPVRTGTYCGRANPTTTGAGGFNIQGISATGTIVAWSVADTYAQFYFQYATKPAANSEMFFRVRDDSAVLKMSGRLDSNGKISLYDSTGAQLGSTGTTVLSANTWYGIRVRTGTGASATYELQIDTGSGFATELSGTGNLGANSNGDFGLGKIVDTNGQSVDFYYDDFAIDSAAYPTANTVVKVITPIANGSTMSWVNGTGPSDYTQVNEIPPDDTTYVQSPTTGNPNVALFSFQSTTTAGITGTVKAFKAMTNSRENTSVASSDFLRISSNGTTSDSTALNGTTSVIVKQRLLETDPNTGSAWTLGGIDAVQAGAVENNAVAYRCSSVLGMVAYVPSSTSIKTINGLAYASVKTVNGLAIANVKTWNGLS